MPLYDFSCPSCGPFVAFHSVLNRHANQYCPQCASLSDRIITAPNLSLMSAPTRQAHFINDRSQHEPKVRISHACSNSCGCAKPQPKSKTVIKKRQRNQRPWMLGH